MKHKGVRLAIMIFAVAAIVAVSAPLAKQVVKRWIRAELSEFIREGSLTVEDISVSPKRRQVRLLGVTVRDAGKNVVISIPKIDVDIHRVHHKHVDARLRVFSPRVHLDLDRPLALARLFRPEAFREESQIEVDRADVQDGNLSIAAPGLLKTAETLAFSAVTKIDPDGVCAVDLRAGGPLSRLSVVLRWTPESNGYRILEGTRLGLSSKNLAQAPHVAAAGKSASDPELGLSIAPADTFVDSLDLLRLNAFFVWGLLRGEFSGIHALLDTPGVFGTETMRFSLGNEELVGTDNELDVRENELHARSGRWTRTRTGLELTGVHLLASAALSEFRADVEGFPIRASVSRSPLHLTFDAERLSVPLALREAGESLPLSGVAHVRAEAFRPETSSGKILWTADISSTDLRVGPAFGKLSMRSHMRLAGGGAAVDSMSAVLEPAKGITIRATGKGRADGSFSGRAVMGDQLLRDVRLVAESAGENIPLVAETGSISARVDFSVDRNLHLSLKGSLRIHQASARARGFPFRVDGLDVDFPLEYTPDTGRLVLDEAAAGRAVAARVLIGPYRFENFSVATASKGDKIQVDVSPVEIFGGRIRAKMLFHFSDRPHQHIDVAVENLSIRKILDPFDEARGALSGLVSGEVKLSARGTDLKAAKGSLRMRASEGPGEPMRVSRRFLEKIGGAAIRRLDLPKEVKYKNGALKVRVADGRIFFDEASLDAETLLRKVRIGRVVGSYRLTDLIDVLSDVSAQDVKVDFGKKPFGGKKRK